MNGPLEDRPSPSFQSAFPNLSAPTNMPETDEQINERPLPAPSITERLEPSYDYAEKGYRPFYQRSIDSSLPSLHSSPTTTISTVDDSSATEPSPGSSPETPPSYSLVSGMLRPRTADDTRPFFELQKQPLPKKGRNLKNLAVNTSRSTAKPASTTGLPLRPSTGDAPAPEPSTVFVKPQTPSKRKPSSLGLTLLTPGTSKIPPGEMKLAIPPTPAFTNPCSLRLFQSSPSLPISPVTGSHSEGGFPVSHFDSNLETILSPRFNSFRINDDEEQNFDIPLSQEEKPEAYPDGPICVYEPYIDLYLEPTVAQAREYDVVMNVASEVRNPFLTNGSEAVDEPELRIDGGGGIQYAPRRDRVPNPPAGDQTQLYQSSDSPAVVAVGDGAVHSGTNTSANRDPEYIHIKWEHNSDIVPDLLDLVKLLDDRVMAGKKVLIHCQCGVSRSASLVVAYGLYKNPSLSVQEAYDAVKKRSKWIGPNMNLIMQLQEFRTSLKHGGLLPTNRGVTPITPSSAFAEWRGPFATPSMNSSSSKSTITAPFVRSHTPDPLPTIMSGPSSAPSGAAKTPGEESQFPRARAVSAVKPTTAFVNPSGRIVPIVPVLKISEVAPEDPAASTAQEDLEAKKALPISIAPAPMSLSRKASTEDFAMTPIQPPREVDSADSFGLMSPTAVEFLSSPFDRSALQPTSAPAPPSLAEKASTEDFAMIPLQPSPEVDSADSFGLMSPTAVEFSSSPFDRSALLAKLGMGSIGQQEDLGPRRSISLRARRQPELEKQDSAPERLNAAPRVTPRLRGKISSPDLREQRRLQDLQARIEARLPRSTAQFSSLGSIDEPLRSPRATEFTQNPFALAMAGQLNTATASTNDTIPASDPRSPAHKGGSPIVRNILDVL